jgi:hypothetical protein
MLLGACIILVEAFGFYFPQFLDNVNMELAIGELKSAFSSSYLQAVFGTV